MRVIGILSDLHFGNHALEIVRKNLSREEFGGREDSSEPQQVLKVISDVNLGWIQSGRGIRIGGILGRREGGTEGDVLG